MVLLDFVYLSMNKDKSYRNVTQRLMEGIMLEIETGFYWPTLFKDACKFVLSCDECQIIGNIGKRLQIIHMLLNHLMFGDLITWDLFLPLMGICIYWLLPIMLLNG